DQLSPGLEVFIEYSNEVWNGGFSQCGWVSAKATAAGMSGYFVWYTQRACQIFDIFQSVMGGRTRMVRVLASQNGNAWITQQIIKAMPAPDAADVIAI